MEEPILYVRLKENSNYFIGSNCQVYSIRRKIFIKHSIDKDGYVIVALNKIKLKMHRIIYNNFVGTLENGVPINHIDNNKKNNSIVNLETTTITKNNIHKMGFQIDGVSKIIGQNHYMTKLKASDVIIIFKLRHVEKMTAKKIALMFKISESSVRDILKRRSWAHVKIEGDFISE